MVQRRQDQRSHFSSISASNYGFCRLSLPICVLTQQKQTHRSCTGPFKAWCTLAITDRREDGSGFTGISMKLGKHSMFSEGRLTTPKKKKLNTSLICIMHQRSPRCYDRGVCFRRFTQHGNIFKKALDVH